MGMSPIHARSRRRAVSRRAERHAEVMREIIEELNRDRSALSRVEHIATIPFGPAMQIERFALGNGLKILLLEDHAAPVVALQMWFAVGSRHERPGKTGIAHLFEHLMFGETEQMPHGAFDRMLEEAGAETNA